MFIEMLIDFEGVGLMVDRRIQRPMHGGQTIARNVDDRAMHLGDDPDRAAIIERFFRMGHCIHVIRNVP
jgi:hypothetical protein